MSQIKEKINLLCIISILYLLLSIGLFVRFNVLVEGEKGLGGLFFLIILIPAFLILVLDFIFNKFITKQSVLKLFRKILFTFFFIIWLYFIDELILN